MATSVGIDESISPKSFVVFRPWNDYRQFDENVAVPNAPRDQSG